MKIMMLGIGAGVAAAVRCGGNQFFSGIGLGQIDGHERYLPGLLESSRTVAADARFGHDMVRWRRPPAGVR